MKRTHFSKTPIGSYPLHVLAKNVLEYNTIEKSLTHAANHIRGDFTTKIDLKLWGNVNHCFQLIFEANMSAVDSIDLSANGDVDIDTIKLIGELYHVSLQALNLDSCASIDTSALTAINSCSNLSSLNISNNAFVTDSIVEFLSSQLTHLKELYLGGCMQLTDTTLKTIGMNMSNRLRALSCDSNDNITFVGANYLVLHCENLLSLDLHNCKRLQFIGIVIRTHGMLQHASRNIKSIRLDGCPGISVEALEWVTTALADLEVANLSGVEKFTDAMAQGLAYGCPNLRELNLKNCPLVENGTVVALALKSANTLISINLANVSVLEPQSVTNMLRQCKKLKSLDVSRSKLLGDSVFGDVDVQTDRDMLVIESLNISNCAFTSFGIACMCERCPRLKQLNISKLPFVTDAAMSVMACCCAGLLVLTANDCEGLTDRGIASIAYGCKELRQLYLCSKNYIIDAWGGCYKQYTDLAVESILDGARKLVVLEMRNQGAITFSSEWLVKSFPRRYHFCLEKLDLTGVDELSVKGASHVLKACYALNHVIMPQLKKLLSENGESQTFKEFVRRSFPHMLYCMGLSELRSDAGAMLRYGSTLSQASTATTVTTVSPVKPSLKDILSSPSAVKASSKGMVALFPHPLIERWRYADLYYRLRWDEHSAARKIQKKYRHHAVWFRIRFRVCARRIAHAYKKLLDIRKHRKRIQQFVELRAVKIIQRQIRKYLAPTADAALAIQKIYRGHRGKRLVLVYKRKVFSATQIQKIARGMLVRLSDRFILAQIYLKLPPFWRQVISSAPPPPSQHAVIKKKMFPHQLSDLREDATDMIQHIKEDIAINGKLAPKIPFVVPQPFDKTPYVSLGDGRKLAFYSHATSIVAVEDDRKGAGTLAAARRQARRSQGKSSQDMLPAGKGGNRKGGGGGGGTSDDESQSSALVPGNKGITGDGQQDGNNDRIPIHMFNITFWPHTEPIDVPDPSTEQHNPDLNSFEVAQNSRTALHCSVCRARLMIIHCKTCLRGYCFFCAFRTHTDASRRNHDMEMIEPRIIKIKEVSQSLVYHIDMAKKVSHDLKYLVRYMRSTAEVKRIQEEKRLRIEFEEAEERRRLAFLKAQDEAQEKHEAVTRIALLYRSKKARRIVLEKRQQKALEEIIDVMRTRAKLWTRVQKSFRQFSTRHWFGKHGVKFKTDRKKRKKRREKLTGQDAPIKPEELRGRIGYELQQRRIVARKNLFHLMYDKYVHTCKLLEVNTQFWLKTEATIPDKITQLVNIKIKVKSEHDELSQFVAAQKTIVTAGEYEVLENKLKSVMIKVDLIDKRVENLMNTQWWIAQLVRSNYRRRAGLGVRFVDTLKRLKWLSIESAVVGRMEFHITERRKRLLGKQNTSIVTTWLEKYMDFAALHQATMDAQQETILLEETNRLTRDEHNTLEFDALIEELFRALNEDNCYAAERVALDVLTLTSDTGSSVAVQASEQLLVIKRKQLQLGSAVLDNLKVGLQRKLNEEDERGLLSFGYVGDDPALAISDMHKISAILQDPFVPSSHCKIMDFLSVYMVEPWLAEQAVGDVRFEENIMAKEVEIDKVKTEVKSLKSRIDDCKEKKEATSKQIKEIIAEIAFMQEDEKIKQDEDTDEEVALRQEKMNLLATEQYKKETEIVVEDQMAEKIKELEPPLITKMETLIAEVVVIAEKLHKRQLERDRLTQLFFTLEEGMHDEIFELVSRSLVAVEHEVALCEAQALVCTNAQHPIFIARILEDDLTFTERSALQLTVGNLSFKKQECLHVMRPRITPTSRAVIEGVVEMRLLVLNANQEVLEAVKSCLSVEEDELNNFQVNKAHYEKQVLAFRDTLLNRRRQRALQKELNQRKLKLEELRTIRMRTLKEKKEAEAKSEGERKQKMEQESKNKKSVVSQIAQATKKGIRAAKDYVHMLKHSSNTAMDLEEQKMAAVIRNRSKEGAGNRPEGIRRLFFTKGNDEAGRFKVQQDNLMERGLPFYQRMEKSVGDQLFIWIQYTFDPAQMITQFELGHKDSNNPQYKDLTDNGFESVSHDTTKLNIWLKREKTKTKGITKMQVSYTQQDETRCMVDCFEKIEPSLMEFGMADISLWVMKSDKLHVTAAQNTNSIISEVMKVRALVKSSPHDKTLQSLLVKLNERLKLAHEKEVSHEVTNPLESAVEFLALSAPELDRMMRIYETIDKDREETVGLQQIYEFFEEPTVAFMREVFESVDAVDKSDPDDETVEFGDFVRAVTTYCFFGKEQILRFLFIYADKNKIGFITHEQYVGLLNILNPYDKSRAKRALKEMNLVADKQMELGEFMELNDKFPNLMHPAFRLQNTMRQKILGVDWWVEKLRKYQQVRRKLMQSGANTDELAEIEQQRFVEDEARERRMNQRAEDIKQEASYFKKSLLQARQLVDELS